MKKILNFLLNTENGHKLCIIVTVTMFISLVIGLILTVPVFWMNGKEYGETWMSIISPYFFYMFIAYGILFLFLFVPYLWYIGTSKNYDGDKRVFLKGMALFCSIFPGAFIYSFIAKALLISNGIHNLAGMFICGLLYLLIVKAIFRKQFSVAQEFIPLS